MLVHFEVIEIVDDNNPYPTLLGFDWAYDMDSIINLNNMKMVFDKDGTRVFVPLDPYEGVRYKEPVQHGYDDVAIDHIYQLTA